MKLKPPKSSALTRRLLSRKKTDGSPTEHPRPPSEREFNIRRRMVAIVDGVVRVAPPRCELFHREWFEREGWIARSDDRAYAKAIRGFADHRGLFLYKGPSFSGMGIMQALDASVVRTLAAELGLSGDATVWLGLRPSPDELWQGECAWGTIDDILEDLGDGPETASGDASPR